MKGKVIENIAVIDIADKGQSVGRVNDLVVFMDGGAVPGDVVDVRIVKKRKGYLQGKITQFRQYSSMRTTPSCEHFGVCGGCKWQNLSYENQLQYKEKSVKDAVEKIGGFNPALVKEIIGSEDIFEYRNKLDYSFTHKRYLLESEMSEFERNDLQGVGFHVPGKFNKVVDINKCWLQDDLSNRIRLFVKDKALELSVPFYDAKAQSGVMRSLIIRNTTLNEWMVVVVFREDHDNVIQHIMSSIKDTFPEITSLFYMVNPKLNDTIYDIDPVLFNGKDHITEKIGDLKFRIGVKSFFQTNSRQAQLLYNIARDFADLKGDEIVYDLYTGTGTIAAFVSQKVKHVYGIESVPEAIEDAKINSDINGITNTTFFAGDMVKILTPEFIHSHGYPDVIITDPPRPGMHEKVCETIMQAGASTIVYVSCNAATMARDIKIMSDKYDLIKVQPVDMFPHTSHVECVALLTLKKQHETTG